MEFISVLMPFPLKYKFIVQWPPSPTFHLGSPEISHPYEKGDFEEFLLFQQTWRRRTVTTLKQVILLCF